MIDFQQGQVLLVDKPLEWTSFDVVNKLRRALQHLKDKEGKKPFKNIKVGHAGTLDPLATGLLIVCTGADTKTIEQLMGFEKEYTGTVFLGASTPSFDKETEVDVHYETSHITEELITQVAKQFTGNILQVPPAHSATIIKGERAYEKARRGEAVDMPPKQVTISAFDIVKIEMPLIHFKVVCSKGTYIRSLANDFGKALQSGAYLHSLCRTRIGKYSLDKAKQVDVLVKEIKQSVTYF